MRRLCILLSLPVLGAVATDFKEVDTTELNTFGEEYTLDVTVS